MGIFFLTATPRWLVVDAGRQPTVAGDTRPGQVVAAEEQGLIVDEDQLLVQVALIA